MRKNRFLTLWVLLLCMILLTACYPLNRKVDGVLLSLLSEPDGTPSSILQDEIKEDSIRETTILSNEYCSVVAKSYESEAYQTYAFLLEIDNKTESRLLFTMKDVSVNGIVCDPHWIQEVAPGETVETRLIWHRNWLMKSEILEVETVEQTIVSTDELVVVAENFRLRGGPVLSLQVINRSDRKLCLEAYEVKVNGIACDPAWAESVPAGKKCYSKMTWIQSDFAACVGMGVERIEFLLRAYNPDHWTQADAFCGIVTIEP